MFRLEAQNTTLYLFSLALKTTWDGSDHLTNPLSLRLWTFPSPTGTYNLDQIGSTHQAWLNKGKSKEWKKKIVLQTHPKDRLAPTDCHTLAHLTNQLVIPLHMSSGHYLSGRGFINAQSTSPFYQGKGPHFGALKNREIMFPALILSANSPFI